MTRLCTVVVTLALTFTAGAPLLCELGCVSHLQSHETKACHGDASGLGVSAGSESCSHAVQDVTAIVAAVKANVSPELACTLSFGVTRNASASALQVDHAGDPPGVTARPRSVSRSILRI